MLKIVKCKPSLMRGRIYGHIELKMLDKFQMSFRIFDIKKRIERPKLSRKVFYQI